LTDNKVCQPINPAGRLKSKPHKIMRQAIVIKNPKWETFTTALEKFKDASDDVVLVIRGRNKSKEAKEKIKETKETK
jgi:hypothetical protein